MHLTVSWHGNKDLFERTSDILLYATRVAFNGRMIDPHTQQKQDLVQSSAHRLAMRILATLCFVWGLLGVLLAYSSSTRYQKHLLHHKNKDHLDRVARGIIQNNISPCAAHLATYDSAPPQVQEFKPSPEETLPPMEKPQTPVTLNVILEAFEKNKEDRKIQSLFERYLLPTKTLQEKADKLHELLNALLLHKVNWNYEKLSEWLNGTTLLDELINSDESLKFAIIKKQAADYRSIITLGSLLEKHPLHDTNKLVEILKVAFQINAWDPSDHLAKFTIPDENDRIEIAKIAARNHGYKTSEVIQAYRIQDLRVLVDIAKIAIQSSSTGISRFIPNYRITDPRALFELAQLAARNRDKTLAQHIHNYGNLSQDELLEIAKILAKETPSELCSHLENFQITQAEHLLEIAKIVAAVSGDAITKDFSKFKITDPKSVVEIAELAAANSGNDFSLYIQNYPISDQATLIKLAAIAISRSSYSVCTHIQNYNIANENDRIELAKLAAQQPYNHTALHIQNFKINRQEALVELAILAAKAAFSRVSIHIQNYQITDQAALIRIAKIEAANSSVNFSEFIKNYNITSYQARVEIALIAAENRNYGISRCIQNYEIADQAILIQIAKIAATQDSDELSRWIKNYGITSHQARIEIALIAARQSKECVSSHIQNYEITDQEALVQIAKAEARKGKTSLPSHIQNYKIANLQALEEIASLCAQIHGKAVSRHIQNFGLNERARCAIAMQVAEHGNFDLDELKHYALQDPIFLAKGFLLTLTADSGIDMPDDDKNSLFQVRWTQILKYAPHELGENEPLLVVKKIDLTPYETSLSEIWKKIEKSPKGAIKQRKKFICMKIGLKLQLVNLSPKQIAAIFKLLESLLELRSSDLQEVLAAKLLTLLDNPDAIDLWIKLTANRNKSAYLTTLLLLPYLKSLKDQERTTWIKVLSADHDGPRLQNRLRCLLKLFQESGLSDENKIEILNEMVFSKIDAKEALKALQAIYQLLSFKNAPLLLEMLKSSDKDKSNRLKQVLAEALQQAFQLDEQTLTSYFETFNTFRQPDAIARYAADLMTLKEPLLIESLAYYVQTVCQGTFLEKRYDTQNNPHLRYLFESHPGLREKWKKSTKEPFKADTTLPPLRTDVCAILYNAIYEDDELDELQRLCDPLIAFLKHPKDQPSVLDQLQALLPNPLAAFQLHLIELYTTSQTATVEKQIDLIKRVLKNIRSFENKPYRFVMTMENTLKALQIATIDYTGWTIENSDDPCDLLLLGQEMQGSCQQIGGMPHYNKTLLAYLLDGKNRALVVKDQTGKIQARCILRLLYDKEQQGPVLFQETIYQSTSPLNPTLSLALQQTSKAIAKGLGVSLLAMKGEATYPGTLVSFGGPVPFEYVDAIGSISNNGAFEITGSMLVACA